MTPANLQACTANAPATVYPWLVYRAKHGLVSIRRSAQGQGVFLVAGESYEDRGNAVLDRAAARRLGAALIRMADTIREAPR